MVIHVAKIVSPRYRRIKGSIISNYHRLVVILLFFGAVFLSSPLQAYDFQGCKDCHKASLEIDNSRSYLHPPFSQRECEDCHAAPSAAADYSSGKIDPSKIHWIAGSTEVDTSHGFVLPGDQLRDTLVVELDKATGEFSRHIIAVPSLVSLVEVEDSGKPPEISDVQVLKVERRALTSATIGWKTDTLTYASVHYGIEDLKQTAGPDKRLGLQHQVLLPNLQPDKTYRFTAVSRDLFGRSQVSKTLSFSTSNPAAATQAESSGDMQGDVKETGVAAGFKRFGTDYLIELTLQHPASVSIGSVGDPRCLPDDTSHAGLSCGKAISIDACLGCHEPHLHPVNIAPTKPGIIIPQEFPTLPGGRITCTSCHNPHSSDYVNLTRGRSERELCVACHQKK
jgi:predicted CXXCH cytochrome family protein